MKRNSSKEIKATFKAYVERVTKLQCLFTGNSNLVIYVKWIESTAGPVLGKKLRIALTKDYGLGNLSENDKIEFEGLYSISSDGKTNIRNPINIRRIQ